MEIIPDENDRPMRAYVGCVPIAIAQVMKFHAYPTSYNWNLMPNSTESDQLLDLFGDIHAYFGDNIERKFDGTRVGHGYDVGNFLMDKFDYQSAIQATYDTDVVEEELLTYRRPVIIRARDSVGEDGHAWVCDGARTWYECIEGETGNMAVRYLYFHMNWGWKTVPTNYNGWYGYGDFSVGNSNYNIEKRMVYRIIP